MNKKNIDLQTTLALASMNSLASATERSSVFSYWRMKSDEEAMRIVERLFDSPGDFLPDMKGITTPPGFFLYTDEEYLNDYDELRVLSRAHKGPRTHADYLRAIEHVDLCIMDGDPHSRRPFKDARYKIFFALPMRVVRLEVSFQIHDYSLEVTTEAAKQRSPKLWHTPNSNNSN